MRKQVKAILIAKNFVSANMDVSINNEKMEAIIDSGAALELLAYEGQIKGIGGGRTLGVDTLKELGVKIDFEAETITADCRIAVNRISE